MFIALAAIVGQALEELTHVRVCGVRLETDRVATVEVLEVTL